MTRLINVTVVYAASDWTHEEVLEIEEGATIKELLPRSSLWEKLAKHQPVSPVTTLNSYLDGNMSIGIYSKLKSVNDFVKDGDRIELYRPLLINPKEARRKKAREK